jgi:hypothetical protein
MDAGPAAAPGYGGAYVPLANAQQLADKLGLPKATLKVTEALFEASNRFRSAVHHHVSLVPDDTVYLDGTGSTMLRLEATPVVSISSVTLDDVPLVAGVDYRVSRRLGILRRLPEGAVWPRGEERVTVVYTHGHESTHIPLDIQTVVLDMAETIYNVRKGVTNQTVLGDTVGFGAQATIGVTQQWADAVDNHAMHRSA